MNELAHNAENHIGKKGINALFGAVVDIAAAAYGVDTQAAFMNATSTMYSRKYESEGNPANIRGSYSSRLLSLSEHRQNSAASAR